MRGEGGVEGEGERGERRRKGRKRSERQIDKTQTDRPVSGSFGSALATDVLGAHGFRRTCLGSSWAWHEGPDLT